MPYCELCGHIMDKKTTVDQVKFNCERCGNTAIGRPEDTLMNSNIRVANEQELFGSFKKFAAEDPCNAKKLIPCKNCDMPYLTIIRIGPQDRAYLVCRCGYEEIYK